MPAHLLLFLKELIYTTFGVWRFDGSTILNRLAVILVCVVLMIHRVLSGTMIDVIAKGSCVVRRITAMFNFVGAVSGRTRMLMVACPVSKLPFSPFPPLLRLIVAVAILILLSCSTLTMDFLPEIPVLRVSTLTQLGNLLFSGFGRHFCDRIDSMMFHVLQPVCDNVTA